MTRRDTIKCIHEPFGDAFYYGPERLSARYENDIAARVDSGFNNSTYQTVFDRFEAEGTEVRLSLLQWRFSKRFPIPHAHIIIFNTRIGTQVRLVCFR